MLNMFPSALFFCVQSKMTILHERTLQRRRNNIKENSRPCPCRPCQPCRPCRRCPCAVRVLSMCPARPCPCPCPCFLLLGLSRSVSVHGKKLVDARVDAEVEIVLPGVQWPKHGQFRETLVDARGRCVFGRNTNPTIW